MDVRGPIEGGDVKGNLSQVRHESVQHPAHKAAGPHEKHSTSNRTDSEINQIVEQLKQVPEVRVEVVAQTLEKLRSGELLTRASAENAAKAILDLGEDASN